MNSWGSRSCPGAHDASALAGRVCGHQLLWGSQGQWHGWRQTLATEPVTAGPASPGHQLTRPQHPDSNPSSLGYFTCISRTGQSWTQTEPKTMSTPDKKNNNNTTKTTQTAALIQRYNSIKEFGSQGEASHFLKPQALFFPPVYRDV